MIIKNYTELRDVLHGLNYVFYEEPFKMNIVGLRRIINTNNFDDVLYVAFKDDYQNVYLEDYYITTDPGRSSLMNPKNRHGTAILKEGQYVDTYAIDYHRGNYLALCQRLGPVTVYRDIDRDAELDLNNSTTETGFFGINIHKAGVLSKLVDGWSAGCQVFADENDFKAFMKLCKTHSKRHGNKFTYTLLSSVL